MTDDPTSLKDLITTAIVCLSPTVAWLALKNNRAQFAKDQSDKQALDLEGLRAELETMRNWAGTEYGPERHDDSWLNPYWSVVDFPSAFVEEFLRIVRPRLVGGALPRAIVELQGAIERFRALLHEHHEFLGIADPELKARVYAAWVSATAASAPGTITPDSLATSPQLSPSETSWLRELYRRNKAIHTEGIGRSGEARKLHESLKIALQRLTEFQAHPQVETDSRWLRIGDGLAWLIGGIGLAYLVAFLVTFFSGVRYLGSVERPREAEQVQFELRLTGQTSRFFMAQPVATDSLGAGVRAPHLRSLRGDSTSRQSGESKPTPPLP